MYTQDSDKMSGCWTDTLASQAPEEYVPYPSCTRKNANTLFCVLRMTIFHHWQES